MNKRDLSNMSTIKNHLQAYFNQLELAQHILNKEIVPYLKDKSIDIENRWKIYISIEDYLPRTQWIEMFDEGELGEDVNLMADMYEEEKYSTQRYSDIFYRLTDIDWKSSRPREFTQEQLNNWRESVLQSGYGSTLLDW